MIYSKFSIFIMLNFLSFSSSAAGVVYRELARELNLSLRPVSVRWFSAVSDASKDLESMKRSFNPTGKVEHSLPKVPVDIHAAWDMAVSKRPFAQTVSSVISVEKHELGVRGSIKKK